MDEGVFLGCAAHNTVASIKARGVQISKILCITSAMLRSGRSIDVAGLDTAVGQLCASCLDLQPHSGLAMRPFLEMTLRDLDALLDQLKASQIPFKSQKAEPCTFHS